jgi:hypothetical protein
MMIPGSDAIQWRIESNALICNFARAHEMWKIELFGREAGNPLLSSRAPFSTIKMRWPRALPLE